jgi:hypothetical protein
MPVADVNRYVDSIANSNISAIKQRPGETKQPRRRTHCTAKRTYIPV